MPDPQKRAIADEAVALIKESLARHLPATPVLVHWDDCDSDECRFWFHFRAPTLADAKPDDGTARAVSRALRNARHATHKLDRDRYTLEWSPHSLPAARYDRRIGGGNRFRCYSDTTWVYVLTVCG